MVKLEKDDRVILTYNPPELGWEYVVIAVNGDRVDIAEEINGKVPTRGVGVPRCRVKKIK